MMNSRAQLKNKNVFKPSMANANATIDLTSRNSIVHGLGTGGKKSFRIPEKAEVLRTSDAMDSSTAAAKTF